MLMPMIDNEQNEITLEDLPNDLATEQDTQTRNRRRGHTKYPIPPPKVAVGAYTKILQALNVASNKGEKFVKYDEVATYAQITPSSVSSTLKYFFDIGLLEREKMMYKPTNEIIDFVNMLNWDDEEEAKRILKSLLLKTWFGDCVVKCLSVCHESTKDEIIKLLGKQSHAERSDNSALVKIFDFLVYANVLRFEESRGIYIIDDNIETNGGIPEREQHKELASMGNIETSAEETRNPDPQIARPELMRTQYGSAITININLDISITKIEEIDEIFRKVTEIKGFSGLETKE